MQPARRHALRAASWPLAAGTLAVATLPGRAATPEWPTRPVRLLVGSTVGGPPDVINRRLAERLSVELGQSVVVENRPSAGGVVALQALKASPPDGHVLAGVFWAQMSVTPSLLPSLPYNPLLDFTHVGIWVAGPQMLVAGAGTRFATLDDVLVAARREPGRLQYGTPGIGSPGHVFMALLEANAGVDLQNVPYRGPGAIQGVLRGEVPLLMTGVSETLPFVRDGRMRPIALCAPSRLPLLPGVPTMAEAGVAGLDALVWHGLVGPRGLPAPVVDRLQRALRAAVADEAFRRPHEEVGRIVAVGSPRAMAETIERETPVWARIVKRAGITAE